MPRYINNSDYWKSEDETYPYEDALGLFRWVTMRNGKKFRLHENFSIGDNFTIYNAYGRIQEMVKTNKRKYRLYSSHSIDFDGNYYEFDIMKDGNATITFAYIIEQDKMKEENQIV